MLYMFLYKLPIMTNEKVLDIYLPSKDYIIQLSPVLECDPTVCLPEKSKVTRGLALYVYL